jgi:hypothetical protein
VYSSFGHWSHDFGVFTYSGDVMGKFSRHRLDLDGPLWHNKCAFGVETLGQRIDNRLNNPISRLNKRPGLAKIMAVGAPGPETTGAGG